MLLRPCRRIIRIVSYLSTKIFVEQRKTCRRPRLTLTFNAKFRRAYEAVGNGRTHIPKVIA